MATQEPAVAEQAHEEQPVAAGASEHQIAIDQVLGPNGVLARAIPHYEDRQEQRRMAAAVAEALADERIALIEAGTGTGKTLAYLVPALLSGKRVVVATGTRTLQDQITRQDIPLLRDIMLVPFSAVVLKGVSNYLCLRKHHALDALRSKLDADALEALERIGEWAEHTETGDRAEVASIADNAAIWAELTTTPDNRLGPRCPFYERCFVTQARRRADKADLIVVNHHLFFADLALRTAHPGARVLPEYDAVIFDEAHQLEDVITEHFGVRVSTYRLAHLVRDAHRAFGSRGDLFGQGRPRPLPGPARRLIASLELQAQAFFAALRRYLATALPTDAGKVELEPDLFEDPARQDAWFGFDNALDELARHAEHVGDEVGQSGDEEGAEELLGLARRIALTRDDLAALAEQSAKSFVYWGAIQQRSVSLCGSPIDVTPYVRDHLAQCASAMVLTSATLTSGKSFAYLRTRLGLSPELADAVAVESPFDYPRQVMLYVPRDLPEPREDDFGSAICQRIAELLAITEGRAFVLFTSHRGLQDAARRLAETLPYPLLIQGQAPRAKLIERFRDNPGSVLLGTGTFWEGVDVPGDALSMVIIDKLPFAPPTDPLVAARMRTIEFSRGEPFADYQLPQAALALKQGFGRLIRRSDDRGIVAVLDRRIVSRLYGRTFFETLPEGIPRTSSIEPLRRWWRDGSQDIADKAAAKSS